MDKYVITGGNPLHGEVCVSGAKNVAMKVILCGLLTEKNITVSNIPLISSVYGTARIVEKLGVKVSIERYTHRLTLKGNGMRDFIVPFEIGGVYRSASMVLGPLLARLGHARVPNPGGCRIGKRPIDRHIDGLKAMGAVISYREGYFEADAPRGLKGTTYTFVSNTHTGTETLILAGVLAKGKTILKNAAEEPEIDDLISLLNQMGAHIKRTAKKTILIEGFSELQGADFSIMPDRNEVVTFAIAALSTGGDVRIVGAQKKYLTTFLNALTAIGASWQEVEKDKIRFFSKYPYKATHITTGAYPAFMTDWQAPWAILANYCGGVSTIHETVYENRFSYVEELRKMGADIHFFSPKISNPSLVYNFNWSDKRKDYHQAIEVKGIAKLHNAVLEVSDLRAGATLVLAALTAQGESVIYGIDHIDRGYENLEGRLQSLGAKIVRKKE